jgi:hypothetical protein
MGENLFLEKSIEEIGVSSWIKKDETTVESIKMLSLTSCRLKRVLTQMGTALIPYALFTGIYQ